MKEEEEEEEEEKPLRVFSFDEARFGLIAWYRRRYYLKGTRPPWIVQRKYKWTCLYAAVEPSTGESFCLYLPRVDGVCFEVFLKQLSEAYSEEHLIVVLDGGPSHTAGYVEVPKNVTLVGLPAYSPELNPVERWFLEFRRGLSNTIFQSITELHEAITRYIEPYWEDRGRLRRLTGFPWWREVIDQL
jgi:transposase